MLLVRIPILADFRHRPTVSLKIIKRIEVGHFLSGTKLWLEGPEAAQEGTLRKKNEAGCRENSLSISRTHLQQSLK